jgi:glycosyltransferase involved in cell wall biosynthesis
MKIFFLVLFLWPSLIFSIVPVNEKGERHIVVITASYNNGSYFERNLNSVFLQDYDNYHVLYVNDASPDNSAPLIAGHIAKKEKLDKVLFINNAERKYVLANQYKAAHLCRDTDIVVILDGDDWLATPDVFSHLNSVYANPDIWMTFGQFIQKPTNHRGWCKPIPQEVVTNNSFRTYPHAPSHLRTFYAGLFQRINKDDLWYENDFFHMTGDNAFTLPIIEMAGFHHTFISKVMMCYNIDNPINDHKKVPGLQQKLDQVIRQRNSYQPLNQLFNEESVHEAN